MKICFPVMEDQGLASAINSHFGSSPLFLLFDSETNNYETLGNRDEGHQDGMCSPFKALEGQQVDAVVVGGLGLRALMGLESMKIAVYRATEGSIADNLQLLQEGLLPLMRISEACSHNNGCH